MSQMRLGLSGETVMEGTPDSIRSQSDLFAELDDLAPLSDPCVSPDHPAGSETDRSQSNTGNTDIHRESHKPQVTPDVVNLHAMLNSITLYISGQLSHLF